MRPSSLCLLTAALSAASVLACGPAPQSHGWRPGAGPRLRVAAGDPGPGDDTVVVSAREARTHLGHFQPGQRIRISVIDAQWTNAPSDSLFDARGSSGQRCVKSGGHSCIGGDAPLMGLILVIEPTAHTELVASGAECVLQNRLFIPNGAEFTVPVDAELALGPNDWEDGCYNNSGAIQVEVERAIGKNEKAFAKQSLSVSAVAPRTFAGRFARGEYLRVSVTGGKWTNDPGAPPVDSAGFKGQTCGSDGHVCVGGEGTPLMGLVLLMSACNGAPQRNFERPSVERRFIPDGADLVLAHEADLFLAPNDWEDGLSDNSGSVRVKVVVSGR